MKESVKKSIDNANYVVLYLIYQVRGAMEMEKGSDWYFRRLWTQTLAKKNGVWYAVIHWDGKQLDRKIYHTKDGTPYCVCSNLKVELDIPKFDEVELSYDFGDGYAMYSPPTNYVLKWNKR
jgi:hypothetical protein